MANRKLFCLFAGLFLCAGGCAAGELRANDAMEAARRAYSTGDYTKAAEILQGAAQNEPRNGDIHLLLAKTFYEMEERDRAIASAEAAVSIDPKNSVYHEWLGRVYGEKADHSGWFSALSLAKKARREFDTAVRLDEKNYAAMQALIEFDCSAPGIAGGGEDKARPEIEKIAALDAAEGHYALGNCRRQKKDFAVADAEFTKALDSEPKSADLVFDIGDYAMKRDQADRLSAVAAAGEKLSPSDPRGNFYQAVADILRGELGHEAEKLIREYLSKAPRRNNYPSPSIAHYWLGRLFESQSQTQAAANEYEAAVKMDSKNKLASEALKRIKRK
jgi:tetratricopeptide (TPR) repeat protein